MSNGRKKLLVDTPSRLHFGMIDLKGDLGRLYGSLGLALKKPGYKIKVEESEELTVKGFQGRRALVILKKLLERMNVKRKFLVSIDEAIPEHVGLGSGTQLTLGLGLAVAKVLNIKIDVEEIAALTGRGEESGVGIYVFKHGGFVLDGGKNIREKRGIPPLLLRIPFPENWFFIVATPEIERGVSGIKEKEIFREPFKWLSSDLPRKKSHLLLMKMIPALVEKEIEVFGEALTEFEKLTGESFLRFQEGIYRHPIIRKGVELLLENGCVAAGQSSWGPTFYGLTDNLKKGRNLAKAIKDLFAKEKVKGVVFVSKARNEGAKIKTIS